MSENNSTPRPWEFSAGSIYAYDDGRRIADVIETDDGYLIVSAVNQYDAHKRVAEALRKQRKLARLELSAETYWRAKEAADSEADAALADLEKAEGER